MVAIALCAYFISLRPPEFVVEIALLVLAAGLQLVPTICDQFLKLPTKRAAFGSIVAGLGMLFIGKNYVSKSLFLGFDPAIISFLIATFVFILLQSRQGFEIEKSR